MIQVGKLIEMLKEYPPDALCYAYEGEIIGLVIAKDKNYFGNCIGVIHAHEGESNDAELNVEEAPKNAIRRAR